MTTPITDLEAEKLADTVLRCHEKFHTGKFDELQLALKVKELLERQRWIPVAEMDKIFSGCDVVSLRYPVQPKNAGDPAKPIYVDYGVEDFKAMIKAKEDK